MSEITTQNEHNTTAEVVENRNVITPYAFSVDKALLGTPLASPVKRGIAMLIDLLCIALMTTLNSLVLAALVTVMFFRAGFRKGLNKKPSKFRLVMRSMAAFMLFVLAFSIAESLDDDSSGKNGFNDNIEFAVISAAFVGKSLETGSHIEKGVCTQPLLCWQQTGEDLIEELVNYQSLSKGEAKELLSIITAQAADDLSEAELHTLSDDLQKQLEAHYSEMERTQSASAEIEKQQVIVPKRDVFNSSENSESDYSLIKWIKGIAADLGLGFGWAAFYFTACTTWFHGRTVGKRLLGIKVIKLDGSRINIWESFGRYGGYGAGLATGLLGFLQIFWDANRQAIQDKISETLVIDFRKPKQSLNDVIV